MAAVVVAEGVVVTPALTREFRPRMPVMRLIEMGE